MGIATPAFITVFVLYLWAKVQDHPEDTCDADEENGRPSFSNSRIDPRSSASHPPKDEESKKNAVDTGQSSD